MLRIIKLFLFIFFLVTINNKKILADEECGNKMECPADVEYPYLFCDPDKNEIIQACISGNPNKADFSKTEYPNARLRKAILPICQGKRDIPFVLFNGWGSNPNAQHKLVGYGYEEGGVIVLQNNIMVDEFNRACERWNCLCGEQGKVKEYGKCPGVINIKYSADIRDFIGKESAGTPMTVAKTLARFSSECDPYFTYGDYTAATIIFNYTNAFIYEGLHPYPKKGDMPTQSFVNEKFAKDAAANPALKNTKLYYYYSVALHELGHALGLGHYTAPNMTGDYHICEKGQKNYGIMNYNSFDVNSSEMQDLSDADKCAFKLLYCPDLVDLSNIYEYEPSSTNLYPNPSYNEVVLEFELEASYDNVTIEIYNGLGNILLTPIKSKTYEYGLNRELINVSSLENGYYYVIINTSTKKYVKPFIVIK